MVSFIIYFSNIDRQLRYKPYHMSNIDFFINEEHLKYDTKLDLNFGILSYKSYQKFKKSFKNIYM